MVVTVLEYNKKKKKKNFGQYIYNFNSDVIWVLEKYNKKLDRQTLSVEFNKIFFNEFLLLIINLLPKI